jgi:outer membrane lipoprotein LolB
MLVLFFRLWLGLLLIAASACSTRVPDVISETPEIISAAEVRRNLLSHLKHWQARGRLSFSDNMQAGAANFVWEQNDQESRLFLRAPLSGQSVFLEFKGKNAVLRYSDGSRIESQDPEQLLFEISGIRLPLQKFSTWLLAIQADSVLQSGGLPKSTSDGSWQINYVRYEMQQGVALPKRLDMQSGDLELRIFIEEWRLLTPLPLLSQQKGSALEYLPLFCQRCMQPVSL